MNTIAHIINPFVVDKSSDLFIAQPITFESMIRAKKNVEGEVSVELLTAQFKEDISIIPSAFRQTKHITRSVLDENSFQEKRHLPLLSDILERLYNESTADYLIYSNVDIGVYPDFYKQVNSFINSGYDSFIINRRRLKNNYNSIEDLDCIYKETGKSHPGFDCFVFHRSIFPKIKLDGVCIGVPFVEISFSQNLFAFSKNFRLFDKEILTFHLGEEIFKKRMPREYFKYNKTCFWKLVPFLMPELDLKKIPYYTSFLPWRILKWGIHPCFPIKLMLMLELKRVKRLI